MPSNADPWTPEHGPTEREHARERDERTAESMRESISREGLPTVPPDNAIAPHLLPGERVLAVRQDVGIEIEPADDRVPASPGRLYLTDRRLVLLGTPDLETNLDEIEELTVAGDRLLVTLRAGIGWCLDVAQPRVLRTLVAAVRSRW